MFNISLQAKGNPTENLQKLITGLLLVQNPNEKVLELLQTFLRQFYILIELGYTLKVILFYLEWLQPKPLLPIASPYLMPMKARLQIE